MVNLDYLYNPESAKPYFNKKFFSDKKLGFQVIENGTILPHKDVYVNGKWTWGKGGIVDSNGQFIDNSFVHSGFGGKSYTLPPTESIQKSNATVIYLGLFYPVWGHVITDNIRRLWFLSSEIFKREFKNCPLVYVPWEISTEPTDTNFMHLLEILGVDVDRLNKIDKPMKFDKIILPDESFNCFLWGFTREYQELIERVRNFALKNQTPTSSKKIYYFHGARQIGEERLAEYFKSKGYEIIRPEKLKVAEQLNLLINAEIFAAPLGSISHNSVFMRDGMKAIFIRRFATLNRYQAALDKIHPMNTFYIDSSLSLFGSPYSNYCYIISKQLRKFFGDKYDSYEEEDFKIFLQYLKISLDKNSSIAPKAMSNYYNVLSEFIAYFKQHEDLTAAYVLPKNWDKIQKVSYQTHVHKNGSGVWKFDNEISNPLDQQLDIQAIKIKFPSYKIYYSVYYGDKEGWSEEVSNGEQAGTTGKHKSIYGIRIRFDEEGTKKFDILYRMHKFDGEWTTWAKNDESLYSDGIKLNAIQIKLEPANTQPDETDTKELTTPQTFLKENDNTISSPRQDLTQIRL